MIIDSIEIFAGIAEGKKDLPFLLPLIGIKARISFDSADNSLSIMDERVPKVESTFEQLKSNFYRKMFYWGLRKSDEDKERKEKLEIQASFNVVEALYVKLITQISDAEKTRANRKFIYYKIDFSKNTDQDIQNNKAIIMDKIKSIDEACKNYNKRYII